jgi:hypothetical protein
MSPHSTATCQNISSCLLSRPESSVQGPNASQTDGCCCGLVFDNTPTYLLTFFGHSLGSFMHCVHGRPGPTNWVFRQLEMKEDLPQKMAIFRQALLFTWEYAFCKIRRMITKEYFRLCEDHHSDQSEGHRQLLLVFAVEEAVFLCQKFWASRKQDQIAAKSTAELSSDFHEWIRCSCMPIESLSKILDYLDIARRDRVPEKESWDVTNEILEFIFMKEKVESGQVPGKTKTTPPQVSIEGIDRGRGVDDFRLSQIASQ